MVKRELNNKKYKGLTGLLCKKIEKIAKTDMGTFCGIDKRYIVLYGYLIALYGCVIAITIIYICVCLLSFSIFISMASNLIRILM